MSDKASITFSISRSALPELETATKTAVLNSKFSANIFSAADLPPDGTDEIGAETAGSVDVERSCMSLPAILPPGKRKNKNWR